MLDLDSWHSFLHTIAAAGFRSADMISSEMALIYSYALYLIARHQCRVSHHQLQRLISRWFMANLLTRRYTGSTETTMEEDLTAVHEVDTPDGFEELLNSRLASLLTNDFWDLTLPLELETSSRRSPVAVTYLAAQVRLGAPVLFSDKHLTQMLDPSIKPKRSSVDRHHLFPRRYLAKDGITNRREVNQVANYAIVEWPDNLSIGAKSPADYVAGIKPRFSQAAWDTMCRMHALPPGWQELEYGEFLRLRRTLMAALIRRAYESLDDTDLVQPQVPVSPDEREVWDTIRRAERRLRAVIRQRYNDRWGGHADARIEAALGRDAMEAVERARTKRRKQFPAEAEADELLDFTYLGQLVQIMVSNDAWDLFKDAFRDKRHLQDLATPITLVRNEVAHFRHVSDDDLLNCRVAAKQLLKLLDRLIVPT